MDRSLADLLRDSGRRFAGRPAVIHDAGPVAYDELAAAVERMAGRLDELGLGDQRLGLLLPNLPTFPLAAHAVWRVGGSLLMLNPLSSPREIGEYTSDAGVGRVLTLSSLAGLLPDGTSAILVDDLPDAFVVRHADGERRVPLEGAGTAAARETRGHAEAAVLYTAAYAGWARGASLSHRNLVANLCSTVEAMGLTGDDRIVATLPMIHAFGLTVGLNAAMECGAAVIPVERFQPGRMLDLFERGGATVFAGVPAMYVALVGAAERREPVKHSLRVALCGGAPLQPEVSARWEEVFGLPLRQGYGLTEAGPVCLFNRVDRPNRPGTLGYPFPGVDVAICDGEGHTLPVDEVGEICVRGANVFDGYLGDGGRDPAGFHGEWLCTGDLGSEDAEGTIRFRGLAKAMFTRNGFNVYPREIERVLEEDDRIAEASAYALPDPQRENEIIVAVRPAPGAVLDEEAVRALCRARLAAYKQPSRIVFEG